MATGGQTGDELRSFGAWDAPRLVGALVLCGYDQAQAADHVRRVLERELGSGLEGGSAFATLVGQSVLESAGAPAVEHTPPGEAGAALAALGWRTRLATVAAQALGEPRLGPGEPAAVAAALGIDQADLAAELAAAVGAAAPPPDPDLVARALAAVRRRRRRRALLAAAVVAAIVVAVVTVVAVVRSGSEESAPRPTPPTSGGSGPATGSSDYAITQWVAVLETGPDAFALYDQVEQVGRIVGVNVFTDAWACYEGFPERTVDDTTDWFLGIAAQEKAEVDELVARVGRVPLVEAQVRSTCVLPAPGAAVGDG